MKKQAKPADESAVWLERIRGRRRRRKIRLAVGVTVILAAVLVYFTGLYGASIAMLGDVLDTISIALKPGQSWPVQTDKPELLSAQQLEGCRLHTLHRTGEPVPFLLQQPFALLQERRTALPESDFRHMKRPACRLGNLQACGQKPPLDLCHPLHKPCRDSRRCLESRMGHHIRHARILVMTDARQYRQRELRHMIGNPVSVETVQVAHRAAAADDDRDIEIRLPKSDPVKRIDKRLFGRSTLYGRLEQFDDKAIGAFPQFVAKILITGRLAARHHRDALHDGG